MPKGISVPFLEPTTPIDIANLFLTSGRVALEMTVGFFSLSVPFLDNTTSIGFANLLSTPRIAALGRTLLDFYFQEALRRHIIANRISCVQFTCRPKEAQSNT